MRNFLSFSLACFVSISMLSDAFAYTDSSGPYLEAVEYLTDRGVIEGYPDGTFRAYDSINRAEFTKIIMGSAGIEYASEGYCFEDVATDWYAKYVCGAKAQNIVSGYPDGNFRPDQHINLVEALKIVLEAYKMDVEERGEDWYDKYLLFADSKGLLANVERDVGHSISRGEMAQLIRNLEQYIDEGSVEDAFFEPHSKSGIYDAVDYEAPEVIRFFDGDTYEFENGVIMKVDARPDSAAVELYYEGEPKNYYPQALHWLQAKRNFSILPLISRHGIYVYFQDAGLDSSTGQDREFVDLEIYTDAHDLFQRCLEGSGDRIFCLTEVARYEPVHESYAQLSQGRFNVVYPVEIEAAAQQTLDYLPACYAAIQDFFGKDQNIDEFTIFFYYPEKPSEPVFAKSDSIIVPFYEYMSEDLDSKKSSQACGVGIFPMAHEMTHVFDFGTQNTPKLREGFANYISRRVDSFESELTCNENNYSTHYLQDDRYSSPIPYPETSDDDAYNIGECYFNRLEQIYGLSRVNELIETLGETRNMPSTGPIGYVGNVNFFEDLIEPIFGNAAVVMAKNMGIDVTCDYSVPFEGYLCEND